MLRTNLAQDKRAVFVRLIYTDFHEHTRTYMHKLTSNALRLKERAAHA